MIRALWPTELIAPILRPVAQPVILPVRYVLECTSRYRANQPQMTQQMTQGVTQGMTQVGSRILCVSQVKASLAAAGRRRDWRHPAVAKNSKTPHAIAWVTQGDGFGVVMALLLFRRALISANRLSLPGGNG